MIRPNAPVLTGAHKQINKKRRRGLRWAPLIIGAAALGGLCELTAGCTVIPANKFEISLPYIDGVAGTLPNAILPPQITYVEDISGPVCPAVDINDTEMYCSHLSGVTFVTCTSKFNSAAVNNWAPWSAGTSGTIAGVDHYGINFTFPADFEADFGAG